MNSKNKGKKCEAKNCDRNAICKGFCSKHYQQQKLCGTLLGKEYIYVSGFCKIIGCGKKNFAKGLCQTHYLEEKDGKISC